MKKSIVYSIVAVIALLAFISFSVVQAAVDYGVLSMKKISGVDLYLAV